MQQWPKDNDAALKAFYGDPGTTQHDLVVWESANLVYVPFPWKAVLAWDPKIVIPAIRCHKKIQEPLFRALHDVWTNVAHESQDEIERMGVHLFGGWYHPRAIRGGKRPSTHSYGCSGDWDPGHNKMFHPGHIDPRFRACFEREGAIWLSHDPMHCQWAMSPKAMPRAS